MIPGKDESTWAKLGVDLGYILRVVLTRFD